VSELAPIEASSTVLVAPSKRTLVVFASLLLAITIAMGLAVTFGVGQMVERSLLKSIAFRQNVTNDILIEAARWVTWLGDAAQRSLVMVVFAAWLLWRKRAWAALVMVVVPPLAGVGSSILKEAFARARPDVVPHLDLVTNLSFPSGHATNAMATYLLAALLIAHTRRSLWTVAAVAVAGMIGASRMLLGVHWPSDVIGGWCWGAGIALFGVAIVQRLEARQIAKRTPILISRPESGA
jgi:undecaprenyl-diphosphatase